MLDKVGWPSQLKQVDLFLREQSGLLRINVHQLSGAELTSIEIEARATLQDLEFAISESLRLDHQSGPLFHLVLRETLLKHEFDIEHGRWKSLLDYGIAHGDSLCLVLQERSANRMISIAVQELSCDEVTSMEINNGATLLDIEAKIREQKDLLTRGLLQELGSNITIALVGQAPFHRRCYCWHTLAEHGIENGATLVWAFGSRLHQPNIADGESVPRLYASNADREIAPCRDLVSGSGTSHNLPRRETMTGHLYQDKEESASWEVMAAPYTPTRDVRDVFDGASSACKTKAKAKRALMRL
jgi:hypothetical protein